MRYSAIKDFTPFVCHKKSRFTGRKLALNTRDYQIRFIYARQEFQLCMDGRLKKIITCESCQDNLTLLLLFILVDIREIFHKIISARKSVEN